MGANDDTLGALLIGVVIACLFLGASLVQTYTYFTVYKTDPWFIKVTVTIPVLCNIVHQIGITDKIYLVMVTHYGDYAILDDIGWGLLAHVYTFVITAMTVQLFYIYRIYMLLDGRYVVLPVFLATATLAEFIMALIYAIKCSTILSTDIPKLTNLVTGVNGTAAGLDIIIASIILFMLMSYRTGFRPTDSMIFRVIIMVVGSGLLTSFAAVGTFLSLYLSPDTYICYPFNFILPRLYLVSLLVNLNSRKRARYSSHDTETNDVALELSGRMPQFRRFGGSGTHNETLSVDVRVETEHEVALVCSNAETGTDSKHAVHDQSLLKA